MGLFGVSKEEEEVLRNAAPQSESRRASRDDLSTTGTSAYETADEISLAGSKSSAHVDSQGQHDVQTEGQSDDQANDEATQDVESSGKLTNDHQVSENSVEDFDGGAVNKQEQTEKVWTVKELDWDDINDKGNPHNWPTWKRWYVTLTTACICLCVSLGSSLYISGVFELMAATGASQELCISGLTFYLIGLAFGPALAAPISETFGRRIVYITSFPIGMLFTMGIGLSTHIYQILILRFFCGLLASPALAVAGGTINDVWRPHEAGFAMAFFCLAPFLGPVLGPIVGGFAAEHKGWKWTMWVSLMFSGAVLPFVLCLPETYKAVILAKRAKKRKLNLQTIPLPVVLKVTLLVTILRPMEMLVVEPIVLVWSFYIAFVFAVLFGFFEAFPIIFEGIYEMDLGVSGLTFIGVGIGLILGVVFYVILDRTKFFPKNADGTRGKRDENGNSVVGTPEDFLFVGKIGAVCLPVALFWLAWTGRKSVHWAAPAAAGIPFGFGLILIFFTNMIYFTFSFPPLSVASALGANNLLRYLLASIFPLFTTQMYKKLHVDWATSIFAFISLLLLPIPWVFQYIGPALRKRSQFGYAAAFKAASTANAEEKKEIELENDVASAIGTVGEIDV